jgi:hypothetical protein
MPHEPINKAFSVEERQRIFAVLVAAQDEGMAVVKSRAVLAEQFGLSDRQVRRIEQEGLDGQWAPLG